MIDFPLDNLDMTPYVVDKNPIECYNIPKEMFIDAGNTKLDSTPNPDFKWKKDKLVYNCFGVINHIGSMHFGHYTAFAKNNGQWYKYDDSHVTKVEDLTSIVSEEAYVLFYERQDN